MSKARKRRAKSAPGSVLTPIGRTDSANAQRFIERFGSDVCWCETWNRWLLWDGARWRADDACAVQGRAKQIARSVLKEIGTDGAKKSPSDIGIQEATKWMRHTASAKGIRDMLELAKPDLAVANDKFDQNRWLLNCENGTVDLRTGAITAHDRGNFITKLCPASYEPAAQCDNWLGFLDTIFAGDVSKILYLQRLSGYWLTGDVREQILPICWGTGANGKTTLVNALRGLLGSDYCITADDSIVITGGGRGSSTERMDLFGRRLAVVSETDDGRGFAEAFVKQLTGGDAIRGRRVYQDTWEFDPTHKIVLVTNHKPRVKATDHAFWRRVKLIHFGVTIPDDQQDREMPTRLRDEGAGILAWAVRGCLDWQKHGLGEPDAVRQATAGYRAAEDVFGRFLSECCTVDHSAKAKLDVIRERLASWCRQCGEQEPPRRKTGDELRARGFVSYTNNGTWFRGVGVSDGSAQPAP